MGVGRPRGVGHPPGVESLLLFVVTHALKEEGADYLTDPCSETYFALLNIDRKAIFDKMTEVNVIWHPKMRCSGS